MMCKCYACLRRLEHNSYIYSLISYVPSNVCVLLILYLHVYYIYIYMYIYTVKYAYVYRIYDTMVMYNLCAWAYHPRLHTIQVFPFNF